MRTGLRSFFLSASSAVLLAWCPPASAEPRPVLAMFSASPWQRPEDVWPIDLNLVVYDDGLIIKQTAWNDGQPQFVAQHDTPHEALALAAGVRDHLRSIPAGYQAQPGILDLPTTYIQYWDDEKSALVEISNYGVACTADPGEPQNELVKMMRKAAHPAFLKACDRLLRLKLSHARAWYPREMLVTLLAQRSRPDEFVGWPPNWPKTWQESADHRVRKVCAPVAPDTNDAATRMPDNRWSYWLRSTAVEETALAWWVIAQKDIVMPGAIFFVDDPDKPLLDGACSTAAFP